MKNIFCVAKKRGEMERFCHGPSDVHVRLTVISTSDDVPARLRGLHNLKVKSFEELCEWVRLQFGDRYSEWEILTGAHWPLTMTGFQQYINVTSVELPLIVHLRNQKHVFQRHLKQATDIAYQEAMQRVQGEQSLRWEDVRGIKSSVDKVQRKLDVLKGYIQCPPQRIGGRTLWALVLIELPIFFWLAMMAIANGVEHNERTLETYRSDSQREMEHMEHYANSSFLTLHRKLDYLALELAAAREKDEAMRNHTDSQWKEVHLQLDKSRTALDKLMVRFEQRYNLSEGNVTARNASATDQAVKKNLTWIHKSLVRLEHLKAGPSSNTTTKPANGHSGMLTINETLIGTIIATVNETILPTASPPGRPPPNFSLRGSSA
eukprot:GEMP01050204.1.p1 GENE.GEMP01050204.1~~GEMP01050204.1.p1  ORF type:complete len:377 (+),score=76.17 GEMP01050204.1:264-1394(+)